MAKRHARILGTIAALGIGLGSWSVEAQAAVIHLGNFDGNECGGQGGFSNCYAHPGGTQQGFITGGSPSIYKYGDETEASSNFGSVTGSEFDIDYDGNTNTLEFDYDPFGADPAIHYFAIKQSDGFALFYDASPITSGSIDLDTLFPNNPGYSHITFFNSGTPAVPEPSTWAMMLAGFFGIGGALRSAKRRQKLTVSYA